MARWNRIRGPAADFELTAALTTPTGFTVRRHFGRGTLDLYFQCQVLTACAAGQSFPFNFQLDGVNVLTTSPIQFANLFDNQFVSYRALQPIEPGIHTIAPVLGGRAEVCDVIVAGTAEFIIIELPAWDQDGGLITL